jgi:TM2 domain-containing membrane protein YozV
LLVPGLGQIYCGKGSKGAAILAAAIVIGNPNVIVSLVFIAASPDPERAWAYWVPRIGHDVMSVWSLVFWIWAVGDAYLTAKETRVTKSKER